MELQAHRHCCTILYTRLKILKIESSSTTEEIPNALTENGREKYRNHRENEK